MGIDPALNVWVLFWTSSSVVRRFVEASSLVQILINVEPNNVYATTKSNTWHTKDATFLKYEN